jgi:hypothetical protein
MSQDINDKELLVLAAKAGFDINKPFDPKIITVRHSNGSWVEITEKLKMFADLVSAAAIGKERK